MHAAGWRVLMAVCGHVSAGTVEGLFMADTGLTCCAFAGTGATPDTVVAGTESGVVHFLELPKLMPGGSCYNTTVGDIEQQGC